MFARRALPYSDIRSAKRTITHTEKDSRKWEVWRTYGPPNLPLTYADMHQHALDRHRFADALGGAAHLHFYQPEVDHPLRDNHQNQLFRFQHQDRAFLSVDN